MAINTIQAAEEMNLYDYVISSFDKFCDLSEGRLFLLNYYLDNVNARYVSVDLFEAVFDIKDGLEGILRVLTDKDKFSMLHAFGEKCLEEYEHSISVRTPYGVRLRKAK